MFINTESLEISELCARVVKSVKELKYSLQKEKREAGKLHTHTHTIKRKYRNRLERKFAEPAG